MRTRLVATLSVTVLLAASAAAGLVGSASASVGASVGAKKPPVKVEGGAVNKGTAKVKNGATTIAADDYFYKKTFQKTTAGETVSVTIDNTGSAQHTFTIDSLDVDEVLNSGDSTTIDVVVPADGSTVVFYCRFHGAPGKMKGAFFTKTASTTSTSRPDSDDDSDDDSGNSGDDSDDDSGGAGSFGY